MLMKSVKYITNLDFKFFIGKKRYNSGTIALISRNF